MIFEFGQYERFVDIQDVSANIYKCIQNDFVLSMMNHLKDHFDMEFPGPLVPQVLFMNMMHGKVHYHTPYHVMSIFNFARTHGIELTPQEKLAIWFHDAVYVPGYAHNEEKSSEFMDALMSPYIPYPTVIEVKKLINYTALHLEDTEDLPKETHKVMDLDLSGFAASISNFRVQNECIEKEFMSTGLSERDFLLGRVTFLETLLEKSRIYHTDFFHEKFEAIARQNIKNLIRETKLRQEKSK